MSDINPSESKPRLLISVRDAAEAVSALHGGCDVLDIKEPRRGALGMADIDQMAAIVQRAQQENPDIISAALGEVRDWIDYETLALPTGVETVKLGMAGLGSGPQWQSQWQSQWTDVRKRFEEAANRKLNWVAVSYADHKPAQAPPLQDVMDAAIETGCAALLVDTFGKRGQGLFEWILPVKLQEYATRARKNGLLFVIAGQLQPGDLPRLRLVSPDIVAIRSAACAFGDRGNAIDTNAVARFKQEMATQWPPIDTPIKT